MLMGKHVLFFLIRKAGRQVYPWPDDAEYERRVYLVADIDAGALQHRSFNRPAKLCIAE